MKSIPIKNYIKKMLSPIYRKIIFRLLNDLQINQNSMEIKNQLLSINDQLNTQNKRLDEVNKSLTALSSLHLGINYGKKSVGDELIDYHQNLNEISKSINSLPLDYLSIIDYISHISKNNENIFKNKNVCVIGKDGNIFYQALKKRGVKKFFNIEPVLKRSSININIQKKLPFETIRVFPTDVNFFDMSKFDIVLVPDANLSSLIFQKYLLDLGKIVSDSIFLTLRVFDTNTTNKAEKSNTEVDKYYNVYGDSELREQIHINGFFEIECVFTNCDRMNKYFDKKISRFSYKNGLRIIRNNLESKHLPKQENSLGYFEKIYVARKIPLHIKK